MIKDGVPILLGDGWKHAGRVLEETQEAGGPMLGMPEWAIVDTLLRLGIRKGIIHVAPIEGEFVIAGEIVGGRLGWLLARQGRFDKDVALGAQLLHGGG